MFWVVFSRGLLFTTLIVTWLLRHDSCWRARKFR